MGSDATGEWKCNLCKSDKIFKGFHTRVKVHVLHDEIKGIDMCVHIPEIQR